MERENLLTSISDFIQDYKYGLMQQRSPVYVNRWVRQFAYPDQLKVLQEIHNLIGKLYLPRAEVKQYLQKFLCSSRISGNAPRDKLGKINFLNLEQKSKSQAEMLKLADEILQEEFSLKVEQCGGSHNYIYLDDCVFSGNRFKDDVVTWINNKSFKPGVTLITYHVARHKKGYDDAAFQIKQAAHAKRISVIFCFSREMTPEEALQDEKAGQSMNRQTVDAGQLAMFDQNGRYA